MSDSLLLFGFSVRLPMSMSSHSVTEFGRITFEFETVCTADCELYFMMVRTGAPIIRVCQFIIVIVSTDGVESNVEYTHTHTVCY